MKKLLGFTGLAILAFVIAAWLYPHAPKQAPDRKPAAYGYMSLEDWTASVKLQKALQRYGVNDKDAELAGLIAHLAEEGYRLGYMEGERKATLKKEKVK